MYKKIFLIFCCLFFLVSCQKKPSTSLDTQKSTQDNQPSINYSSDQIQTLPTQTTSHPYEVTILMYHYIRDYTDSSDPIGVNLSVSPNTFDRQMKWLKDHDYQSFGINELDKIAQSDPNVKPVIITFDDGYQDAYQNAFPILKKYGFKGVFYIIAESVGNSAYMDWNQIKELQQAGMIIGSHTVNHPDLRNISSDELFYQLSDSRHQIENHLGISVTDFCYPAGKYNEQVIAELKETGYQTATTVDPGLADQDTSPYELPRYRITNDIEFGSFFNE